MAKKLKALEAFELMSSLEFEELEFKIPLARAIDSHSQKTSFALRYFLGTEKLRDRSYAMWGVPEGPRHIPLAHMEDLRDKIHLAFTFHNPQLTRELYEPEPSTRSYWISERLEKFYPAAKRDRKRFWSLVDRQASVEFEYLKGGLRGYKRAKLIKAFDENSFQAVTLDGVRRFSLARISALGLTKDLMKTPQLIFDVTGDLRDSRKITFRWTKEKQNLPVSDKINLYSA